MSDCPRARPSKSSWARGGEVSAYDSAERHPPGLVSGARRDPRSERGSRGVTPTAMTPPREDPQGTDLLAQEIREEAGRLVHHPVVEVRRLEGVVEEGESAATPLLLFVGVALVLVVVAGVVMTLVFLAYYEG